jgi:hypothetical protein
MNTLKYLVLFLFVISVACNRPHSVNDETRSLQSTDCENGIQIKKLTNLSSEFEIEFSYPLFCGFSLSSIEKNINDSILKFVGQEINDFKVNEMMWCNQRLERRDQNSALHVFTEVNNHSAKYLAVKFIVYIDWSGDPIPNHFIRTLNFDMKTGKILHIFDFVDFKKVDQNEWVAKMQKHIGAKLYNPMLKECNMIWTSPMDFSVFSNILVEDDGIRFVFDPYQLSTAHCGVLECKLSWLELKGI